MRFVLKLAIIIVAVAAGSLFWLPDALQQRGRGVETPQTEVGQRPSPADAPSTIADVSFAPVLPPGTKAARVEIMEGPALELAREDLAILRWTTNNPGGTDVHFAVVFYGTTPGALSQAAQNQTRINPTHPDTVEGQMNIYDTVAFGPRVPIFNLAGRYTGEVRPIANWGPWRGTALGRPCSEYAWRTGPQALAQRR